MKERHFWLAAAIIWCAAIFIATASPSSTGGNTQLLIEKFLQLSADQAALLNFIFRKFVHLSAFGLLAILFYNSFEKRNFFIAWMITTLYAATDEIHQVFVPSRTGSVVDVGIDSLGALIALLLLKIYIAKKKG
ncbi:VanZ family protein [Lederbergia citrea]|uniref:VanZ family protein n=1 Tax=Lederbergia citrea TaxID=2833581 RepID=UPI001BC99EBD|nr:VanZ family protein [Lederbergia citrea]MBS4178247.1 VanZ family protein [Lederbergia citrea]MBS4204924.1 VanZ family protein [Lederbergia citrea]